MLIEQMVLDAYEEEPGHTVLIVDELFDRPLYGFYVVVLEEFEEGDVQGTLMTPPFEIYGPYETIDQAREVVYPV